MGNKRFYGFVMNWFLPIALFASLSFRTPNVQPNPIDYEMSFGLEKPSFYLNRQWERELGNRYIDDESWAEYTHNNLYIKEHYLHKESRGVSFNRVDTRYKQNGWSLGYSLRTDEISHNLVAGYEFDKRFNIIVSSGQLTFRSELYTDFGNADYSVFSKVKFGLLQNLYVSFDIDASRYLGKEFIKSKIKLEVELPAGG